LILVTLKEMRHTGVTTGLIRNEWAR